MKPLLAYTIEDPTKLEFPVLASPKLDGIRCLIVHGRPHSRSLKLIPNTYIQEQLAGLGGLDGELIVGDPKAANAFNVSTSAVMSRDGQPKFTFWVFDLWDHAPGLWFEDRLKLAKQSMATGEGKPHSFCKIVAHKLIHNVDELLAYEAQMLIAGFEGIMVRRRDGLYKHGRSTAREGILGKLKRFADSEAVVCGFVEQMQNNNVATVGELGQTKRSSHKANKVGKGTLGTLEVRDIHTGVSFEIGTGFDDKLRAAIWADRKGWMGAIVKYKHQLHGAIDKPRLPVFMGLRAD